MKFIGMQQLLFVLSFVCICGFFVVDSRQFQNCDDEEVTNLYGELSYRKLKGNRRKYEECNWTFSYDGESLDYVVVLDFSFIYRGSHENNSVQLPSDEVLSEHVQYPPCQAYYNAHSSLNECLVNLTRLYCSETPIPISSWPPKMITRNHQHSSLHFELSYIFVTCPFEFKHEVAVKKPTSRESKDGDYQVLLIALIIALGSLFFLSVVAFFVLLCKMRHRSKREQEKKTHFNNFALGDSSMTTGGSKDNQAYEEIFPQPPVESSVYNTVADSYGMNMSDNSIYQHLS